MTEGLFRVLSSAAAAPKHKNLGGYTQMRICLKILHISIKRTKVESTNRFQEFPLSAQE